MSVSVLPISPDDARRHAVETVKRSGTSFGAGMRILSPRRRAAMYAVYAFCREVDDIADEGGTYAEKTAALSEWRLEVDRIFRGSPASATGVALLEPVVEFDLPKDEFFLVIEGMEIDAEGPVIAPSWDELFAYTRRAAGAVGMLSMPIFGAPKNYAAQQFALALGDALQLTNILRDVEEDAAEGRIYLPRELLDEHRCTAAPTEISLAEGLPNVRAALAEVAREKFLLSRQALAGLDWKVVRPALLMMGIYERYLDKMELRGWANGQAPIAMSKWEKLAVAVRWFVAPKLAIGAGNGI